MAAPSKEWVSVLSLAERLRVRIRRGHGCLSLVIVVCRQVEVSATGQSLIQRTTTECGVSQAHFTCYSSASSVVN